MKIKELPNIERPREKLIKYGTSKLVNEELLAIILSSGTKKNNVIKLSKIILDKFKDSFIEITVEELTKIPGLGPAKACKIVASIELGKRLLQNKPAAILLKPQDIFNELKDIRNQKKEHFVVFYLDTRNQEIKREIISIGNLNTAIVHPREVYEPAVKNLCAQVIVAHNHPSGILTPSQQDIDITENLAKAGKILGIELIDHIIVTRNDFYSFKNNNLL